MNQFVSLVHNRYQLLQQQVFTHFLLGRLSPIFHRKNASQLPIQELESSFQIVFLFSKQANVSCIYIANNNVDLINHLQYVQLHLPSQKRVLFIDKREPQGHQSFRFVLVIAFHGRSQLLLELAGLYVNLILFSLKRFELILYVRCHVFAQLNGVIEKRQRNHYWHTNDLTIIMNN